jgi:hypothetical protein
MKNKVFRLPQWCADRKISERLISIWLNLRVTISRPMVWNGVKKVSLPMGMVAFAKGRIIAGNEKHIPCPQKILCQKDVRKLPGLRAGAGGGDKRNIQNQAERSRSGRERV